MPQPRSASIGSRPPRVEREGEGPQKYGSRVPTLRRNPDAAALRRDRRRGLVLAVVAFVGLVAEAVSLVQDGLSAPKTVALVCFAFLFWWGWELRKPARSERSTDQ
jgi:hypothetical protein